MVLLERGTSLIQRSQEPPESDVSLSNRSCNQEFELLCESVFYSVLRCMREDPESVEGHIGSESEVWVSI